MKKIVSIILVVITLLILTSCKNEENGGSINPGKNYAEVFKLDFISFGVTHKLASWSVDTIQDNGIDISEIDMEYLRAPLGRDGSSALSKDDIINLGILDEEQKEDFEDYTERSKNNAFKIGFCISNDTASENYGKQIIWITNLGWIENKEVREELGYNLFYESKILDFNYILEAAKDEAKVDEFSKSFLNDDFTGIYLHNYSKVEEETILNFYVMMLEEETKVNLVKFDVNIAKR